MAATSLRMCLSSLGGEGNETIEYIETYYGNRDYITEVCRHIDNALEYDQYRTENQTDMCESNRSAFMYPSRCNQNWLGDDCYNNCSNDNYRGFYCKRMCSSIYLSSCIIVIPRFQISEYLSYRRLFALSRIYDYIGNNTYIDGYINQYSW